MSPITPGPIIEGFAVVVVVGLNILPRTENFKKQRNYFRYTSRVEDMELFLFVVEKEVRLSVNIPACWD